MIELAKLTRADRLLILTALEVDTIENTGSGRNAAWGERVDLVLEGRKGLFDYSDEELLEELEQLLPEDILKDMFSKDIASVENSDLVDWARRMSFIGAVDPEKKSWDAVPKEEQERWRGEEKS